jgi:hypothetical protein
VQLQLNAALHATPTWMPAGAFERFRTRALREGIAPRSAQARPSPFYALVSTAAVFVIVAALVFMPPGQKAAESLALSAPAPIPSRQSPSARVTGQTVIPRPLKAVHAHAVRHGLVSPTDAGLNDASLVTLRFPQAFKASYPFFGKSSVTQSSLTGYPALSRAQISRLDLFHNLRDSDNRNPSGAATPIDIASTGNVFDFAGNIRQLHFQLSTAQ